MPFFPQLTTGAVAQFPVSKRRSLRTVLETAPGGQQAKLEDPGVRAREWMFDLSGLSSSEASALESLFAASEGRLREFSYLDPMANLFAHSENLSQAVWIKSALLQVTAGIADPLGTTRASRLTAAGAAEQILAQDVAGPGNYWYAMSCWIRAVSGTSVTLRRFAGPVSASETHAAGPAWRHIQMQAQLASANSPVRFELRLQSGAVVDVFGLQVEAQRGASVYKMTGAQAGVYPNAMFAQDELEVSATYDNQFSTTVRIRTW